MNAWGITAAWCAFQVTLVGGAAGIFILLSKRKAADVGPHLALAALGGIVFLTLLAFSPPLTRWSWQGASSELSNAQPEVAEAEQTQASVATAGDASPPPWRGTAHMAIARLRGLLSDIRGAASARVDSHWPRCLAALAGVLAGCGLLRLVVGLRAVQRLCRRSMRIEDTALLALLAVLRREMKCRREITVRESPDLATAATVGGLRPILILPPDWRTWSVAEHRAVLAHELAHIQRHDYLSGLLAQAALAMHFYHPLVHWLVRHLHLQQELAADALGARFAGGRGTYLTALARLALRQEGVRPGWPARAFLPAHGTLMRRIQMLRDKETAMGGWLRARRWLGLTTMVGVALGVGTLRGPAQPLSENQPSAKPVPGQAVEQAERQPFDCRYLGSDIMGVFAMRPAAILSYPSMKPHAKAVNLAFQRVLLEVGVSDPGLLGLHVEDIEQVVAGVHYRINPKAPKGQQHEIQIGQPMIHTVRPMDWAAALQPHLGNLEKRELLGKAYYICQSPVTKFGPIAFFFPDDRTFVCDSEPSIQGHIKNGAARPGPRRWDRGWRAVEGSLFALSIDFAAPVFRDIHESSKPEDPTEQLLHALLSRPIQEGSALVVGFDGKNEEFLAHAVFVCQKEDTARFLVEKEVEVAAHAREDLRATESKPSSRLEQAAAHFVVDLLDHASVTQQGADVDLRMSTKLLFGDVVREMFGAAGAP